MLVWLADPVAHGAAYTEEARGSIGGTWREVRSARAPPTSPSSPCMTITSGELDLNGPPN